MKASNLKEMRGGWFIGPFLPTLCSTDQFECAVKRYQTGDKEPVHFHRLATEYTVVVDGSVKMNGVVYERDSIVEVQPGEAVDFEALTDVTTFVIKIPAVIGDKYVL